MILLLKVVVGILLAVGCAGYLNWRLVIIPAKRRLAKSILAKAGIEEYSAWSKRLYLFAYEETNPEIRDSFMKGVEHLNDCEKNGTLDTDPLCQKLMDFLTKETFSSRSGKSLFRRV